jgi:protease II
MYINIYTYIYVYAYIGEMGRYWYEDEGKYLNKQNTFNDFADCAKHLARLNIHTYIYIYVYV